MAWVWLHLLCPQGAALHHFQQSCLPLLQFWSPGRGSTRGVSSADLSSASVALLAISPSLVTSRGYALQAQEPALGSTEASRPITTYIILISLCYLSQELRNYCQYLFPSVASPSVGRRSRLPSGLALCPRACLEEMMAFNTTSHSSTQPGKNILWLLPLVSICSLLLRRLNLAPGLPFCQHVVT